MKQLLPLALALAGCSDYELNTQKEDSGIATESAGDTGLEDTGSKDTGSTITFPFRYALDACLGMDESSCQWNKTEGGPDSACVADAEAKQQELLDRTLAGAETYSGRNDLTLTDLENGEVPATVYAYYGMNQGGMYVGADETPVWFKIPYLHISWGHNRDSYASVGMPMDDVNVDTLRCAADNFSWDSDLPPDQATFLEVSADNYWKNSDGSVPSSAQASVEDFTVMGGTVIGINGTQIPADDPNSNFASTETALDQADRDISAAAMTLTGVTGEGSNAVVVEY